MSSINEELLIEAVRDYTFLYDASDPSYHDNRKKDNAWKQIAEQFEQWTGSECKKKWIALRDSFRKAYKKRRSTSGQAAKQIRPWKYESVMSFIIPHLGERSQISNLEGDDEDSIDSYLHAEMNTDNDNTRSTDETGEHEGDEQQLLNDEVCVVPPQPKAACAIPGQRMARYNPEGAHPHHPVEQVLNEYLQTRKTKAREVESSAQTDALCTFFKAMEQTVKTFTVPLQIEIKGKIANLVNEYEAKNYQNLLEKGSR